MNKNMKHTGATTGAFAAGSCSGLSDRPAVRFTFYVLAVLSALHFLRSYFVTNLEYLDYARYESGTEKMPYQGRFLMALLLRFTHSLSGFAHFAARLHEPFNTTEALTNLIVDLLSIGILVAVITALYRRVQSSGSLAWLPYFLTLWMLSENYVVRSQQAIYMPYDLFADALFLLALYLCYIQRYLLLLLVFSVACINRETILLIVPLLFFNLLTPEKTPRTQKRALWREPLFAGVLLAIWIGVHLYVKHRFAGNPAEGGICIRQNLRALMNPGQWPQIASACGFLLPIPFLFWAKMHDRRLRLYSLIIPVWVAIMFTVGLIGETRVFGELIGFLAVYCTVLFENIYFDPAISNSPATDQDMAAV